MFCMRLYLIIAFVFVTGLCSAQAFFPNTLGYNRLYQPASPYAVLNDSTAVLQKKWSLQSYKSLSLGMMFWKGGSASYISAPIGLQLTRTINNNLFAFAAVSAAPAIINFGTPFNNSTSKNIGLRSSSNPYQLSGYGRAELGLGYTNDARTFTITGSIGVERSTYPLGPGFSSSYNAAYNNAMMHQR
jgi:hypothetical protein